MWRPQSGGAIINLATGTASAVYYGGIARNDRLSGFENVLGSDYNDRITGDSQNNVLSGAAGYDTLDGNGGQDHLIGGAGNDVLYGDTATLGDAAHADTLDGGSGNDEYWVNHAGDTVIDSEGAADKIRSTVDWTLGSGIEHLQLMGAAAQGTGNALDNRLTGNEAANRLSGLDGHDTVEGFGGADTLLGGNGNDHLRGGAGADHLDGGAGIDTAGFTDLSGVSVEVDLAAVGADGTVTAYVRDASGALVEVDTLVSIENLAGGSGDDRLAGDAQRNQLDGGLGNDVLRGRAGNDVLFGNQGDDAYLFAAGDGADLVSDAQGANDKLVFEAGLAKEDVVLSRAGNNLVLSFTGGERVTVLDHFVAGRAVEWASFADGTVVSLVGLNLASGQSLDLA
jgi:Ca2+-binding RTX toxin-like protein